ncbi:MAG: hypothetical protein IJ132_02210 [Firmicutes bacterium]|nr:hypothetical protein [Bacillota bacterium]
MRQYVLGIDTSNYTTSVALIDQDFEVAADNRIMLSVKKGERGLRQQEALFQHTVNLPVLLERTITPETRSSIKAVCVSSRPRPVEGSYMPCFLAGVSAAKAIALATGAEYMEYSHQEGHIAAIDPLTEKRFLSYHLSGGTCELLLVGRIEDGYAIEIIGGSNDISIGQLLDRTGVALGYAFPAGKAMDELADRSNETNELTGVRIDDLWFNLSGLETQVLSKVGKEKEDNLVSDLFRKIERLLVKETEAAIKKTGLSQVVFAGGVSKSSYIREGLRKNFNNKIIFGELSEDNAVGTALLGGRKIWL